jgi:hypothetical protein
MLQREDFSQVPDPVYNANHERPQAKKKARFGESHPTSLLDSSSAL